MRESGMWARGSSSYRTSSRPLEPPRSRYESHSYDQPEYDGDSRAFPPPSSRGYSGNSYSSGSPMDRPSREMRYGDGGNRMGPPHQGGGMGPHSGSGMGPQGGMGGPQGPMMGPGPMGGGGGMDSGPRGGNQPPMMNSGSSGVGSGYGGGGPGGGNGSGGGPNHAELYSSIQTLSQMNAQQNDIAAKLISAVLSTNLVKNIGGPQGSPYPPNKMGSGYDDHGPFPPGRSPPVRGGGPRQFGPPGRFESGRFDKFTRERRGRSPRVSFSGRLFKTGFDKLPVDPRKRPGTDLRRRLGSKRSWSDDPAKDDTSKFKRHRRSSEEMSENGEHREKGGRDAERSNAAKNESESEKNGDSQSKDKDKDKEKEDELSTEALYCHMCKHGNFTSEKTYLYHLEGVRHRKTALAFHAKNEATLEFLRKNAKLAIIRFGGLDNTFAPSYCSICTALVKESFYKHKKLLEHKIVKKFLRPKCCGRFFKTRYEMDEHRLSLPHLKNIHNSNQKSEEMVVEEFFKGEPPKWSFDEAIKHLMSRNPIENRKLSLDNIPPFDGNTFIGVEMLQSQQAALCVSCHLVLPITAVGLESHVTSIDHYNKVLEHLGEKKKEVGSDVKKDEGDEETKKSKDEGRRGKDSDDEDDDEGEEVPDDMQSLDDMKELANDIEKELPFIDESDHIVLEEIDGEDAPLKEVGEDVE